MKKSLLNKSVLAAGVLSISVSANAALGDIKPYVGVGVDYNTYSLNKFLTNTRFIKKAKGNGFALTAPVLGIKFNENFGVEAGYSFNKKITVQKNTDPSSGITWASTNNANFKVKNMFLDVVGSMPIADKFELIAGLGISKLNAKISKDYLNLSLGDETKDEPAPGAIDETKYEVSNARVKNKYNWRAKLGAQYNFNSNFAARLMFTYQPVSNKLISDIKHSWTDATTGTVEHENDTSHDKLIKNIKTFSLGVVYTF